MKGTARQIAVRCLIDIFDRGGYSNLVLDAQMKEADLSAQERAFCTALLYGVAEKRLTLDWALARYSQRPIGQLYPTVREILRVAAYQLLYMPSVPQSAAVDEAVKLSRVFGAGNASGYVNGVLRSFLRGEMAYEMPKNRINALSIQYSVPKELVAMWNTVYGKKKADAILEGSGGPPPVFARVNTLRITPAELIARLKAEGVEAAETGLAGALRLDGMGNLPTLPSFREGLFHIQDLSSQACAAALEAAPGMRVLDVCAAPGGKSFTIAEGMENRGELLAMDISASRLQKVESGAQRLGLSILTTRRNDASIVNDSLGQFDRILCDVVCSGFGVIRRKPEIRYKPLAELKELPAMQLKILTASAGYLAPGGRLIYSTCTLNPAENERVVKAFFAEHPEFSLAGEMTTTLPTKEGGDGFFFAPLTRG